MSTPEQDDAFGANSWLIDEMREAYQNDPDSVDASWRRFFANENNSATTESPQPAKPQPTAPTKQAEPAAVQPAAPAKPKPEPTPPPAAKTPKKAKTKPEAPAPGTTPGLSANAPNPALRPTSEIAEPVFSRLRGAAMRTAANMEQSLEVPTATSVRSVPMKLVIDQRTRINSFLRSTRGGKVSFTHLIAFAMIRAIQQIPEMNNGYQVRDGKPNLVENPSINLGIAIDLPKPDGTRQLLVPNLKGCESLDFSQFWSSYENLVLRARNDELTVADYAGTTATITNPGGIGTNHSVPRLMTGQGLILGVGAIDYPAEFQGTSLSRINDLGVSKTTTLTSTYDHRVIQGAQSGEFLKVMHSLLLGEHGFYDEIFEALRIPYEPLRWSADVSAHRANQVTKHTRVLELINAFRSFGHLVANTDPLEYRQRAHEDLRLETHGLSIWDLDREFAVGVFGSQDRAYLSLRDIMTQMQDSYCRTLAVEYMHIPDPEQRSWFQQQMEVPAKPLSHDEHMHALDKLNEAEVFETFLQTKYVGQKRFSLEGGESLIVLLDEVCQQAANDSLDEVCIGMPHRGRLNVLANIIGKKYSQIFREFDGTVVDAKAGTGDVKYHLGSEGEFVASNGAAIKASVAANPSHLEAVDPVVQGIARAKQDVLGADDYPVLPILLHGDASFAGQGVVFETLQMSQLRGYRTGGTIHVVVNNQVGFTTAPSESRSSIYATDVAKAISAPVLHINGDDPDSCIRAARIAFAYRQAFNRDIVIDMVCYRRRGHNEGDDPSFTQPRMYDLIEQKRSVRRIYTESLIGRGDISMADAEDVMNRFRARLETVFKEVRNAAGEAPDDEYTRVPYYPTKPDQRLTAITSEALQLISQVHTQLPPGFTPHPKVLPQLQRRADAILNGPIDWATAEILAFGSLLLEDRPVRLAGQDSRRGTFSQRFAAIVDRVTNEEWVPLKHLSDHQAPFAVYDSLLSEFAAMGFEYGYSVARPDALVLWEAQFGDFVNGAQTISDEFVSSGQAKWGQKSGVVLLLPHGFEGQGPDHSSARLERWLQLCAENALAVCQPSTAASYFHLLRQHAYVNFHRPVVIATPKSMLRNKFASSMPGEFTSGAWQPVIDDPTISDPSKVRSIIVCSGKIRWELVARRAEEKLDSEVAIVALERLYPLSGAELAEAFARYPQVDDYRFVQDEPENQGGWPFLSVHLVKDLRRFMDKDVHFKVVARPWASAPSVGSHKVHLRQSEELMQAAFARPAQP